MYTMPAQHVEDHYPAGKKKVTHVDLAKAWACPRRGDEADVGIALNRPGVVARAPHSLLQSGGEFPSTISIPAEPSNR